MNYIIAAVVGSALGLALPTVFKNIELKKVWAALIGLGCGLAGYHTMQMALGSGWWAGPIAALLGVLIVGLNLSKPYFTPKFPKVTALVRLFLGLFMFSSGVMMLVAWFTILKDGGTLPGGEGPVFEWLNAVIATGFLWQWIFIFKIIFGLLVLIPRTSTIGILGALAYYINITIYTVALAQLWLGLSIPAITATVYLVYAHWEYYKRILEK